jgi:hypothetical protein
MKTIQIKPCKPRNPLVAASRMRLAGAHRAGPGARRQQAIRALRAELDRLRTPIP